MSDGKSLSLPSHFKETTHDELGNGETDLKELGEAITAAVLQVSALTQEKYLTEELGIIEDICEKSGLFLAKKVVSAAKRGSEYFERTSKNYPWH